MNPIAVTLLTGFLGAGKTTLLRHILNEQHGYKIAVIENEFGEVSVDDQLIGDRATQIKTLTNGCICCSRSNELEDALLDLLDNLDKGNIQFDRLVIECTGMADPGPIIQTFFSHEVLCQRYLLDGVIALVDAVHADGPAVQHQRFYAGRKRRQHQATFSLYRGQTKRYFVDCGGTGLPGRYQRSFPRDGKPAAGVGG